MAVATTTHGPPHPQRLLVELRCEQLSQRSDALHTEHDRIDAERAALDVRYEGTKRDRLQAANTESHLRVDRDTIYQQERTILRELVAAEERLHHVGEQLIEVLTERAEALSALREAALPQSLGEGTATTGEAAAGEVEAANIEPALL
jgi:hypothetical protein